MKGTKLLQRSIIRISPVLSVLKCWKTRIWFLRRAHISHWIALKNVYALARYYVRFIFFIVIFQSGTKIIIPNVLKRAQSIHRWFFMQFKNDIQWTLHKKKSHNSLFPPLQSSLVHRDLLALFHSHIFFAYVTYYRKKKTKNLF